MAFRSPSKTYRSPPLGAPQSKMAKTEQSGKLWCHEERLFGEKTFYLNKSTSKYVNIGLHPESLEPRIRICDRVSGSHISIKRENLDEFVRIITSILDYSYKLDQGFIEGSGLLCGIKFYAMGNRIWKLTQVGLDFASVLIHQSSFKTYLRIARLISLNIDWYDTATYNRYIEELRTAIGELGPEEIIQYLYDQLPKFTSGDVEFQVLADLISNQESYMDLKKFNVEFYNRNTFL